MENLPPIFITASLDAGRTPQVVLSDVRVRTLRHMEGLIAWLREPCVKRVVFAKNCTRSIRAELLNKAAARHGKELEFVQVAPSHRTPIQGKGYGEGDLIRQVLQKSEVLRAARDFIKVTGKLYMPDAPSVFTGGGDGEFFVSGPGAATSVFPTRHWLKAAYRSAYLARGVALLKKCRVPWGWIAAVPSGWIDTRCYRSNVDFYRRRLLRSHERVHDALGYTLENSVFDDLDHGVGIRRISAVPIIVGTSGTFGSHVGAFPDDIAGEASDLADRLLST